MQKELIQDYLRKSGMPLSQAETLSRILAQMATKDDMARLDERFDTLRFEIRSDLQSLEARLNWRMVSIVGFFAAVMTLLDLFID